MPWRIEEVRRTVLAVLMAALAVTLAMVAIVVFLYIIPSRPHPRPVVDMRTVFARATRVRITCNPDRMITICRSVAGRPDSCNEMVDSRPVPEAPEYAAMLRRTTDFRRGAVPSIGYDVRMTVEYAGQPRTDNDLPTRYDYNSATGVFRDRWHPDSWCYVSPEFRQAMQQAIQRLPLPEPTPTPSVPTVRTITVPISALK
jgi:hypothetical protein